MFSRYTRTALNLHRIMELTIFISFTLNCTFGPEKSRRLWNLNHAQRYFSVYLVSTNHNCLLDPYDKSGPQ